MDNPIFIQRLLIFFPLGKHMGRSLIYRKIVSSHPGRNQWNI